MNRNNIFMGAYIVFIFICAWIGPIPEFKMWGRVVVAITTASWLFAFSDCLNSMANWVKDLYKKFDPLIKASSENLFYLNEELRRKDKTQISEKKLADIDLLIIGIERIHKKNCFAYKLGAVFVILSTVVVFLAFLLFLCILSIDSLYNHFYPRQEMLTVFSFGMILSAQFLANFGGVFVKNAEKTFVLFLEGIKEMVQNEQETKNAD